MELLQENYLHPAKRGKDLQLEIQVQFQLLKGVILMGVNI